jgi:predicted transposase YdaD
LKEIRIYVEFASTQGTLYESPVGIYSSNSLREHPFYINHKEKHLTGKYETGKIQKREEGKHTGK